MSLLEDRLFRILELRLADSTPEEMTEEIGLPYEVIEGIEDASVKALEEVVNNGASDIAQAAKEIDLHPITTQMLFTYSGLELKSNPRHQEIRDAIADGAKTTEEIAKIVGLKASTVKIYAWEGKITLPGRKNKRRDERQQDIRDAIADGAASTEEIAKTIGLSVSSVRSYASDGKITLPDRKYKRTNLYQNTIIPRIYGIIKAGEGVKAITIANKLGVPDYRIRELMKSGKIPNSRGCKVLALRSALERGERYLEVLCQCLEVTNGETVFKIAKEDNIKLPRDLIPYLTRPEIDVLVEQGYSLGEISEEVGLTKERVRQHIRDSGQTRIYQAMRRTKSTKYQRTEERLAHKSLISIVKGAAMKKAREEGWPQQKALEYKMKYKK